MPDKLCQVINSITPEYSDEPGGLSSTEALHLLEEHGPNSLPEKSLPSGFVIFLSQLKNPLVYILLLAGGVTFFLHEFADTAIIGLAVFVNTILGFVQERKAGNALAALKKLVHPHAQVIRDGKVVTLEVEKLVPGDVVLLKQGDKIPADGCLLEDNRFFVTEAILTGESEAISKKVGNEVFMGTIVTAGKARMRVALTGGKTEMGKIAQSISNENEATPLGKQLVKFSKQLSIFVFIMILAVFAIGALLGQDLVEIFTTSVALAVSAIPEGLLVGLTVVLAIGMQRILARKGLVRNLVSAETLGGVTTICVDKTGTLTHGRMQVVNVLGDEQAMAQHTIIANDLDTSVVVAAWEWGNKTIHREDAERIKKFGSIDSISFSSEHKFFASLNKWHNGELVTFVTGAPEVLLEASNLTPSQKKEALEVIDKLSSEGKRLLGFARRKEAPNQKHLDKNKVLDNLTWVGMLAFNDPIRTDVKGALQKTRDAGIKLVVITGDYANTAISVLKELGLEIVKDDVVLGEDLTNMSKAELEEKIFKNEGTVKLFARTKPDQKYKIVETLKDHGEVVAMMGDGVNDAPALSKADIGIVVGEASDVAKESADLVLLDSGFNTIVAAIEEGRGIFDNIRKIILYLMSDAFEEILLVLSSLILRLPLPITAVQILWINLVSDGFPHLALTIDPKAPGIMNKGPRSPKEALVSPWMLKLIGIVSITGWIFAMGVFVFVLKTTGDVALARSVTFLTVGINSLVYVFSVRTLKEPFWKEGFFENKWLLAAVGVGFMFQIFPYVSPGLRSFFDLVPLGNYWLLAGLSSIMMFFGIEVSKFMFRHKLR